MFGDFRVSVDSTPVCFATRKSKSLLAYLTVKRGRPIARGPLAGELWPGAAEDRALRALNTELWRLKVALRTAGGAPDALLHADHNSIALVGEAWIDVDIFGAATNLLEIESAAVAAIEIDRVRAMIEAVELYRGDFLEGLDDEWCFIHREAWRARLIAVLETLVQIHMAQQRWDHALVCGRRLLEIDPLLEHIHRALMQCHLVRGNRPAALRQYAVCATVLRRDLRVEPMEETRLAYEAIRSVTTSQIPAEVRSVRPLAPRADRSAGEKIDLALSNLRAAQGWLQDIGPVVGATDPPP
jgi:DNA-binding SARP family transcriptional activator